MDPDLQIHVMFDFVFSGKEPIDEYAFHLSQDTYKLFVS